jgi:hypothetical protein
MRNEAWTGRSSWGRHLIEAARRWQRPHDGRTNRSSPTYRARHPRKPYDGVARPTLDEHVMKDERYTPEWERIC